MSKILYYKYPKTPHFSFSPGVGRDDRILESIDHFIGKHIIATVKMDGENFTINSNGYTHARSIDSKSHPSRDWINNFTGKISHEIPQGWRIVGENLFAKHSIHYNNLKSYFYVFSIWDENNNCLSWNDVLEWCSLLELEHVPVIYDGIWNTGLVKRLHNDYYNDDECEGFVVRVASSFDYVDFDKSVAKYVRESHVQTDDHWMHKQIIKNQLGVGYFEERM